jgi:fumarylacetoacetate (FAA) hydrolase family protein
MSSQEQFTNQSDPEKKLIKIELTVTFDKDKDMTPNILTPLVCQSLKDMGATAAVGSVKNVIELADEVNAVAIVCN